MVDRDLTLHRSDEMRAHLAGESFETIEDIALAYLKAQSGEVKLAEMVEAAYAKTFVKRRQISKAISDMLGDLCKENKVTHVRTGYWVYNH